MGSNFNNKILKVNDSKAFIVADAKLHSVAQIIAHLTFWNKDLIAKIEKGKGDLNDSDPSNWPSNNKLRKIGWPKLLVQYYQAKDMIIKLLAEQDPDFLMKEYFDQDFDKICKYHFAVIGMIQHTIYHLGQIGIIIKFLDSQD